MQHSFSKLLRKNLLYMALPVVLILSAFLLLMSQVSRLEMFQSHSLDDISRLREYYTSGQTNVTITLEGLKSTGISVMENEDPVAEYFYLMVGGRMQLILLSFPPFMRSPSRDQISS